MSSTRSRPTPDFDETIRLLAYGDRQIRCVETDATSPAFNHHALHVDDFATVYQGQLEHEGATVEVLGDP